MKMTTKLILNVGHHGWAKKNIFHSALPKTALKLHFFYLFFILLIKNIRFVSYTRRLLLYERTVKKNHLKKYYAEFWIHTEKDHLCFYENCTDQT